MKNSTNKILSPFGNRVLLNVPLIITKQEDGSELESPSQEAKVVKSNVEGLNRGDTVFFNPYGAVSVNSMKTKKSIYLIVDSEDIYGKQ